MRLLVLGGTVFCSRTVVAEALRRGHEVDAACRGTSGDLPDGARHLPLDRSTTDAGSVLTDTYDAVVDVARQPGWVRSAVAATPSAHHVLVSTISVYPDTATPGGSPATLAVHEPLDTDGDELDPVSYGRRKVACEQAVAAAAGHGVARPGLIVGPGDPSGRHPYWVSRLVDAAASGPGTPVLAPGDPADGVQVVDVRDLAAWVVDGAERRWTGVHDAVGPVVRRDELLAATARGVGADPAWVWADEATLARHGVEPWAGPRSLPLWLPAAEYAGMLAHDPAPARAAGLRTRPHEDTARDTATWLAATPDATVGGLTRDEEAQVLAALA